MPGVTTLDAELRIVEARPQDAVALAAICRETFEETFAAQNDPDFLARFLDEAYGPAQQAAEIADPAITILLAYVGDALAGYVYLKRGPVETCVTYKNAIEILRFYARSGFHGRGLGPAMMRACRDRARAEGYDAIWLGVWEHNPRAKAFYAKWGFREVGSHPFDVGGDIQTDLVMQARIKDMPA